MGFAGDGGVCALLRRAEGPEERRLLELFSYGLMALGAASALLLCFIPMPYGRYSSRRFGWLLPARPAWALQELPSLLVPLGLAACGGVVAAARPNRVLLGCFVLHYAHRCGLGRAALPAGTGGAGANGGRSLPCCGQEKGSVCTEIPGCCLPTEGVEVLLVSVCYLAR